MKIQGAVIKEQGLTFAIVIVKPNIVDSQSQSSDAIQAFTQLFPNMPITLMAQNTQGIPTYRGRQDIVNFLANIHPSQIPWKEYHYS